MNCEDDDEPEDICVRDELIPSFPQDLVELVDSPLTSPRVCAAACVTSSSKRKKKEQKLEHVIGFEKLNQLASQTEEVIPKEFPSRQDGSPGPRIWIGRCTPSWSSDRNSRKKKQELEAKLSFEIARNMADEKIQKEKERILQSLRKEREQKTREAYEQRLREARSESREARRRQREADGTVQKLHESANVAEQKLLEDIEGQWLMQANIEEPAGGEHPVQSLTLPIASIKNGVLTWAPRLNREGNFRIELEQGGFLALVDGDKRTLGTLQSPSTGSKNDPLSVYHKLRWNTGEMWIKAPTGCPPAIMWASRDWRTNPCPPLTTDS